MDRLERVLTKLEPWVLAIKIVALFGSGVYALWLAIIIMGNAGLLWAATWLLFVLAISITSIIDIVFRLIKRFRGRND